MSESKTYPLAPNGIFRTIQGEGILSGLPSVFVRFAGCSIGCPQCDTDYTPDSRKTVPEIVERVSQLVYGGLSWVWLTGGEPTDRDIDPLVSALRDLPVRIALATAGIRVVKSGLAHGGVDFLSVSPHDVKTWVQQGGSQLNIVPGLNDLQLVDVDTFLKETGCEANFPYKYVTPCDGMAETLAECRAWVDTRPGWRLNVQAHKLWQLP